MNQQQEMTELSVNEIQKTETTRAKQKRLADEQRTRDKRMAECLTWLEAEVRKQAEQEMREKVERFNAKYSPNNNPRRYVCLHPQRT